MITEKMLEIMAMAVVNVKKSSNIKSVEYLIEGKTRYVNIDEYDMTQKLTRDPISDFRSDLEDIIIRLFVLFRIQSVDICQGLKVITYGDDLDPNYCILKDNEIVEQGSNGFSDGYVYSAQELVKHFLS